MLPGGITETDLTQIWGNENWMSLKEKLMKASLLVSKVENEVTKYALLPVMNKYAEAQLSQIHFKKLHMMCVDFYLRTCKKMFKEN